VTWEPITRAELDVLLGKELESLDPETRAVYERYRIEPEVTYRVFKQNSAEPVPSFVIARSGADVLFYDDIEEEWGTAAVSPDGRVYDWGTWSDVLCCALRNFPVPEALRHAD
jgi:hypothetical protein